MPVNISSPSCQVVLVNPKLVSYLTWVANKVQVVRLVLSPSINTCDLIVCAAGIMHNNNNMHPIF